MLVIPAAPVTPPLAIVENEVIGYLRDHRFTLPNGIVVTTAPLAQIAGAPLLGQQPVADAQSGLITVSPDVAQWGLADVAALLLHETLHETPTGGADDYAQLTPDQFVANEQATEATTQDLLPGLLRRLNMSRDAVKFVSGYAGLVKRERVASAVACHCGWTTAPARAWRARFFLTPPAERELIH